MNASRENFIKVLHGKMELNIPLSLFEPGTAEIIPSEAEVLRRKLRAQYPWLTDNAVDIILKRSKEEMTRQIDGRKPPAQRAREMLRQGKAQEALAWLDVHLDIEPDDVDACYARAEALFKLNRQKEGFEAMHHAKKMAARKGSLHVVSTDHE